MRSIIKRLTSTTILIIVLFQVLAVVIEELNTTVLAVSGVTEEISRDYEIKEEATFDLSEKGDNSVIGKYTLNDRTLRISGVGEVGSILTKYRQYLNVIENIVIGEGITSIGKYAFSGCSRLSSITIPERVTSIGVGAFYGCNSLTSITIPEGITSIEYETFYGCSSLTSIIIPEEVTSIKYDALFGCSSLESINVANNNRNYISENGILFNKNKTKILSYPAGKKDLKEYKIPEGVISIGDDAFSGCSGLISINIPEGVTSIGIDAFGYCSNLTSITIPEGVTSIGWNAFRGCSSLTSITIPEGVTSIGRDVFRDCSSLIINVKADSIGHKYVEENKIGYILDGEAKNVDTKYEIKEEETFDLSEKGDNSVIGKYTLKDRTLRISGVGEVVNIESKCRQYMNVIKNIIIGEGITSIGKYAFSGCSSLTSITISEGITSIENYAFEKCSRLESINVANNNRNYISESGILFNKEKRKILCYPAGKKDLKEYKIPEGVISIGDGAFEGCSSLISITIPEEVTSIGSHAFYKCSNLTNITIPEGVTGIGDSTFVGCSSLTSINIPEGITSIEDYAFYGCSSLTNITIPKEVTNIGRNAFDEKTIIYTKYNTEGHRYAENQKIGYFIDDTGPTITFETKGNTTPQKNYSVKVKIGDNIEIRDTSLKYIWTQSETEPENISESFKNGQDIERNTGDGEWYLWVCAEDKVGNRTIKRSESFNFDNTAPKVEVEYSTKEMTKGNVTVKIKSNEAMQEKEGWKISEDRKVLIKEYSENKKETITIKDIAGNEEEASIEIANIDKIAPKVEVEYSTKEMTKGNVTVKIKSNEAIQEKEGWTISVDKKELTKEYSENTKETIIIKDIAGNEAEVNIEIKNIILDIKLGDINNNNKIDITDLLLLKRHIISGNKEEWKLKGNALKAADINRDEKINITDMLMLKRKILENIK